MGHNCMAIVLKLLYLKPLQHTLHTIESQIHLMVLLCILGTARIVSQATCTTSFVALGRHKVYATNPVGQIHTNDTVQAES